MSDTDQRWCAKCDAPEHACECKEPDWVIVSGTQPIVGDIVPIEIPPPFDPVKWRR